MEERKQTVELEEKDREREFEIQKIQMLGNSRERMDVNPMTNPCKQWELLRLLKKYDVKSK